MLWLRAWQLEREGLYRVGAVTTACSMSRKKSRLRRREWRRLKAEGEFVEIGISPRIGRVSQRRRRISCHYLFREHGRNLPLGGAVDAGIGPIRLPLVQIN